MKKSSSILEIKKNLSKIGPAALISATAMGPGTITSCLLHMADKDLYAILYKFSEAGSLSILCLTGF